MKRNEKCEFCGDKHKYQYDDMFKKAQILVYLSVYIHELGVSKPKFMCRPCLSRILDTLKMEQHTISNKLQEDKK